MARTIDDGRCHVPGRVSHDQESAEVIRAERGRNGRFRLVEPLIAPADRRKVESLLAALSSLRVADGAKGFAADDARDLGPFGLSPPEATIEIGTIQSKDQPMVLDIGKSVPGQVDRVYARQGDQDDVVIINSQPLSELPKSSVALRSKKVSDFDADRGERNSGKITRREFPAQEAIEWMDTEGAAGGKGRRRHDRRAFEADRLASNQRISRAEYDSRSATLASALDDRGPRDPRGAIGCNRGFRRARPRPASWQIGRSAKGTLRPARK